nr:MAG TPA: SAM-dependent methyltransferases related to tRNA (uracil-5-)-methyltransferase [Caudoviricetes sp.]
MLKISKVLDWFLNVFSLILNNSLPRIKYKLFEWNRDTDELVFNSLFDLFVFISKSCIRLSKPAIYFGGKYYLYIGWYESFSIDHKKLVNEIDLNSINVPIYDLLKEIATSIQHTGINNIVINKDGYIKISKLLKYDVKDIIYVSCNPKTFNIDLKVLQENGYELVKMVTVDMFPVTPHMEVVSRLKKLI